MIELPPAVVGNVDDVGAVLDREARVFRGGNAFENQRQTGALPHPREVGPVEPSLVARISTRLAQQKTVDQIALAPAVVGAVDRHADRAITRVLCADENFLDPFAIAAYVELKQ